MTEDPYQRTFDATQTSLASAQRKAFDINTIVSLGQGTIGRMAGLERGNLAAISDAMDDATTTTLEAEPADA